MFNWLVSRFKRVFFWTGLLCLSAGIILYILALVLQEPRLAAFGLFGIYIGVRFTADYLLKLIERLWDQAKPMFHRRGFQVFGGLCLVFLGTAVVVTDETWTIFTALRWGTSGFLLLCGLGLAAAGYATYWRRNLVMNTPTSRVRSLPVGTVEVKGTARAPDDGGVTTPLTQIDCLGYEAAVERFDMEEGWVRTRETRDEAPFYLEDETGTVIVDPAGARYYLEAETDITVEGGEQPPDELVPEHKEHYNQDDDIEVPSDLEKTRVKLDRPDGVSSVDRRYIETCIMPGDSLYVYGWAEPLEETMDATTNADRLVIGANPGHFFAISDMPEDELIDELGSHTRKKLCIGLIAVLMGIIGVLWSMDIVTIPLLLI